MFHGNGARGSQSARAGWHLVERKLHKWRTSMTCSSCKVEKSGFVAVVILVFLVSTGNQAIALSQSVQSSSASSTGENALPDAPQSQNPPSQSSSMQQSNEPSGAAGAKAASPKGAPVAQPAGAAVAPAKQHGHRSLLIKIGLLAGAGVAIGSAAALSHGSPSRPPGASSAASQR